MSNLKEILINKKICKSVWFMRQAGRYLPEFRKIRSINENFINLCLDSNLSSEITLQPIKRFDLDSAIIFSDILIVPHALGQKVDFIKGKGPILENFNFKKFINNDKITFTQKLFPVYKAIEKTRKNLDKKKTLISFIGAPWTLLVYMLGVKLNKNEIDYKQIKEKDFEVNLILDKLNEYLCTHIENQINHGADVVQIFDSWAGLIAQEDLPNYCYIPNLKIVEFCKTKGIPVICFQEVLKKILKSLIILLSQMELTLIIPLILIGQKNLNDTVIQGGLDPNILLRSEQEIINNAKKYLDGFKGLPYVFNLGHGMLPETNPDKVGKLIKFYREY